MKLHGSLSDASILTEIKKESRKEKLFRMLAILLLIMFPIFLIFCFRAYCIPLAIDTGVTVYAVVKQYKRAIILRFGRVRGDSPAGPGVIWLLPCTDTSIIVDLRTQSFNLPSQEILTKDSVTVIVDAVVYYHIQKPLHCFLNVETHRIATQLLSVSSLRNILGQYTLTDLLSNRVNISHSARAEIAKITMEWGVEMERVEIKDIILPFELQKAMAAEAEGTRIGKAKIIESEGEIKAAENLREAAIIMADNPHIMLLRYLQTLNFIASQQSTTIFFPFPMELPEPYARNTIS